MQRCGREGGLRTLGNAVDGEVAEIDLLRVRAERVARVAEEVLSDLGLSELLQVLAVSVHAPAGLVELDDGDGIPRARGLLGEAAGHVAVEPF